MYFVYNSKTREVIGLYNMRDVPAWLNLNEYMMLISDATAADAMIAQITEIAPDFFNVICTGTAEEIYKHYIRRGNLRRIF